MAPLALYLASAGYSIAGQDDNLQPRVRDLLSSRGIAITDTNNIPADYNYVGYSSAINARHPLYQSAEARGATLLRRGELLAQAVVGKKLVAIVGSHGKTTTTGLLIQMLEQRGFDCGYVLGGLFRDAEHLPARASKESPWVVAEIDESDGTIEHFSPEITVMVNFDWDHPDKYSEQAELESTFDQFFERTQHAVFLPSDTTAFRSLQSEAKTYSAETADFNQHNLQAATAAFEMMTGEAGAFNLSEAWGIARRQDVLFAKDDFTVIADYAHHPAEVTALLQWVRQRYSGKVVVVFQPHRYSRTQQFAAAFAEVLEKADEVILMPVYAASEALNADGCSNKIAENAPAEWPIVSAEQLPAQLAQTVSPDEATTLLFVGAGDIDKSAERIATDYSILASLREAAGEGSVVKLQEPLKTKTTLRVGGPARYYAEPANEDALIALLSICREASISFFPLGRGSNLVVSEEGFDGLVIRLQQPSWRSVEALSDQRVRVGAGIRLKQLCGEAAKLGLSGFEFLEGIPGSLGGALRMNAGAMGGWMFDVVESVRFLTAEGNIEEWPMERFSVAYRSCRELVGAVALSAVLRSSEQEAQEAIRMKMETYASGRKESQPKEPSAGCTFKNPDQSPAGKLIDELGLKGLRIGDAEVSPVHGNFIVNRGQATTGDVIALVRQVRERVLSERSITLEPEVLLLGQKWEDVL